MGRQRGETASRRGQGVLAAFIALLPAGCGWHSLYADRSNDPGAPELATVHVEPIAERVGQIITISLRDGFNPTGEPYPTRYRLFVGLRESHSDLSLRNDETTSRTQYSLTANFFLRDAKTNVLILNGTAVGQDAFDRLTNSYSIVINDQAAQRHAAEQVVLEIEERVAAYLQRNQLRRPD